VNILIVIEKQNLVAIDKRLIRTDVKVKILENVYEMTCESMHGAEIRTLEEVRKETGVTQERFFNSVV
jgi:hypothetical protein